jgi:hypothetical protein
LVAAVDWQRQCLEVEKKTKNGDVVSDKVDGNTPQNCSRNGYKPRAWAAAFWSLLSIGNVNVSKSRKKPKTVMS